VSVLLQLS